MQHVFVATTTKFSSCLLLTELHRPIIQGSKQQPFILKKKKYESYKKKLSRELSRCPGICSIFLFDEMLFIMLFNWIWDKDN